jgi:hypothetical protein
MINVIAWWRGEQGGHPVVLVTLSPEALQYLAEITINDEVFNV